MVDENNNEATPEVAPETNEGTGAETPTTNKPVEATPEPAVESGSATE